MIDTQPINHVSLSIDASSSVSHLSSTIIKVVDNVVADLAKASQELDQETRVSLYTFADEVKCLIYDKDVLRLPSIAGLYRAQGQTALIDGTMIPLDDLRLIPTHRGNHFFVNYTMTDGEENNSRKYRPINLTERLTALPTNWVAACYVPDQRALRYAIQFGFPKGSVEVWDATSPRGAEALGASIRQTNNTYMRADAATRQRASRSGVFTMDVDNLTARSVSQNLVALSAGQYRMYDVDRDSQISSFVEGKTGVAYVRGSAYYHLTKTEKVQPQKQVCVYDRKSKKVYTGDRARDLLGLPGYEVSVHPNDHPNYDVFVQSTSVNRKLVPGTKLLLLS